MYTHTHTHTYIYIYIYKSTGFGINLQGFICHKTQVTIYIYIYEILCACTYIIHTHTHTHTHTYIYIYIYIYISRLISLVGRVFAKSPGDLGPSSGRLISKTFKIVLLPPCLTLCIIRYVSRVKCRNSGEGVAPSATPWCSSYWKRSLRVTIDYSLLLYLYIYIYIYIYIYMHVLQKDLLNKPIFFNIRTWIS